MARWTTLAGTALLSCLSCETPEPPETGSWTAMADGGEATAVRGADAADFADGRLFVWGASYRRGFLYTEATDSWRAVSTVGQPPPRAGASVLWANGRVLWWGTTAGKVYDPATDTWSEMSVEGAPSAREQHSAVWTGARMIVWGGQNDADPRHGYANDGAVYDPVHDTWTPMAREGAPSGRIRHATAWSGTKMIVWGGQNEAGALGDGAVYDPAANRWTPISGVYAPRARFLHTATWTKDDVFIWGGRGCEEDDDDAACEDGRRYNPELDLWVWVSPKGGPATRIASAAVWTGGEVLVWGGFPGDVTGRRWALARDAWGRTATANAPSGRGGAFAFWTGERMLVWGGTDRPSTGAFYRP
ncbi:MAG: hypothetical protein KIT84_36430 [Labilithrix sp.]|nr:hypothetical protein [Labilithrix sp.]MCW5816543.1 hypothetical protein [Labilithrix sp.]